MAKPKKPKKAKKKALKMEVVPDNAISVPLIPEYAFVTGTKAKLIAVELQTIQDTHGMLNPKLVVEEARQLSSPLHDWPGWQGWNKDVLAETALLNAARRLVGMVRFRLIHDPRANRAPVRALVTLVEKDGTRNIKGLLNALPVDDYKEQLIRREMSIIAGARLRLRDYSELADVVGALDHALGEATKAINKLSKAKHKKKPS